MGTPNQFKYYLLNKDGLYYYMNGDTVSLTAVKTPLTESPDGWDKVIKSFTRGTSSLGIFTKTTTPFKFYGDVKRILDSIYYIEGGVDFEAYALLRMEKRIDDYPNTWEYALDFEGELDFSTWEEGGEDDNVFVSLNMVEKGISELLEANEDIEYTIPFDGFAKNISHDGIDLKTEYRFTIQEYTKLDNIWDNTYAPFVPVTFDGIYPVIKTFPVGEIDLLTSNPMDNKLFIPEIDITGSTLTLQGSVEYYNGFSAGVDIKLFYNVLIFRNQDFNTAAVTTEIYKDPVFLASGNSRALSINAQISINFNVGDYVIITYGVETSGAGSGNFDIITNILDLYLRGNYRLGYSLVPSYDIYEFADRMVQKVTEGAATLQSSLLSTINATGDDLTYKYWSLIPRRLRVSSGEGVRDVTQTPVIKYTWGDLKQLLQSIFGMVGFGVAGNKVIIEPIGYFLNNTELIDIGEVKNLKITTAKDFIYNSVKVGYPDKDYQDINGRDIVHSEVNYSLGIKRIKKEMNLIAPAVADPYAIEQLRSYQFKPTTDNSNDNELVLFYCEAPPTTGDYLLQRYSGTQNGGVYSPTTFYNQVLYPVMNMYRNLAWFKAIKNAIPNASQSNMTAVFQSGQRNTEATVKINTPYTIAQNEPVYINNVSTPPAVTKAFVPVEYEFEHEPVNNLFATILNDPYKYISFTSQGKSYKGYILNVDIASSDMDIYTFKLLGA